MDEHDILIKFRKNKIMTIEKLMSLLQCSAITVRRRLKIWGTFTSINQNGRYYTLPEIPEFDGNGLWKYQFVIFSKHGNLKQTIIELIKKSEMGLSAADISKIIEIPSSSSYFSQLKQSDEIKREKHDGVYIYFSDTDKVLERQIQQRKSFAQRSAIVTISDPEAIMILVAIIRKHDISPEDILALPEIRKSKMKLPNIQGFMEFHGLLKKTPDSGR